MAVPTRRDCAIYCDATVADSVIVDADNRLVRWEDLSGHGNYVEMLFQVAGPLYNGTELVMDGERLTSQVAPIPSSGDFVMVAYAVVFNGGQANILWQPGSSGLKLVRDSLNRFRFDSYSGGALDAVAIGGIAPSEAYRVWLGCRRGNDLIARVDDVSAIETHGVIDDAPASVVETSNVSGAYRRLAVIPGTFSDNDLDAIVVLMSTNGLEAAAAPNLIAAGRHAPPILGGSGLPDLYAAGRGGIIL